MQKYQVWLFPTLSVELEAPSQDEAKSIEAQMNVEDFIEHTDMFEISIQEIKEEK